jgi:hypothetical protein
VHLIAEARENRKRLLEASSGPVAFISHHAAPLSEDFFIGFPFVGRSSMAQFLTPRAKTGKAHGRGKLEDRPGGREPEAR